MTFYRRYSFSYRQAKYNLTFFSQSIYRPLERSDMEQQVFFRSTNPLLLREILFCCLILKSHANTMRIKHSILSIITQSYNNKCKTSESKTSFKQLQTTKFLVTLNNIMDFKPCTGILHYKPLGYLFCYEWDLKYFIRYFNELW